MRLENVKLSFTGGVDGGRGWKGDAKNMLLDTTGPRGLGWNSKLNSREAIAKTAQQIVALS